MSYFIYNNEDWRYIFAEIFLVLYQISIKFQSRTDGCGSLWIPIELRSVGALCVNLDNSFYTPGTIRQRVLVAAQYFPPSLPEYLTFPTKKRLQKRAMTNRQGVETALSAAQLQMASYAGTVHGLQRRQQSKPARLIRITAAKSK